MIRSRYSYFLPLFLALLMLSPIFFLRADTGLISYQRDRFYNGSYTYRNRFGPYSDRHRYPGYPRYPSTARFGPGRDVSIYPGYYEYLYRGPNYYDPYWYWYGTPRSDVYLYWR